MMELHPHAFGVDDIARHPTLSCTPSAWFTIPGVSVLFPAWVTFAEPYWGTFAKRRRNKQEFLQNDRVRPPVFAIKPMQPDGGDVCC